MTETIDLDLNMLGRAVQVTDEIRELLIDPQMIVKRAGLVDQFFTIGIKGYFWEQSVGEKTIEYPANWWEHTKKALGLEYKKSSTTFTFKAMYPDFKLLPQLGRASMQVHMATMEPFTQIEEGDLFLNDTRNHRELPTSSPS